MPPTFFGCLPRQKIDQKRHLSSRLSRIHFCDLVHGGGLVFGLHAIVASPAGRDQSRDDASRGRKHFNPRVPCGTRRRADDGGKSLCPISTHASLAGRDADECGRLPLEGSEFQPTRPLRDATYAYYGNAYLRLISTHASLAGRDGFLPTLLWRAGISTHASLAGRDQCEICWVQSEIYFNPRVPCGTRRPRYRQEYQG